MKKNYILGHFSSTRFSCSFLPSHFLLVVLLFAHISLSAQWFNDSMSTQTSGTASPQTWQNTRPACNPAGIVNNGVLAAGTNGAATWVAGASTGAYAWAENAGGGTSCTFTYTLAFGFGFTGSPLTATISQISVKSKRDANGANTFSSITINGTSYTPSSSTVGTSETTHTIPISPSQSINGPANITIVMTFTGANAASAWMNQIDDFRITGSISLPPSAVISAITATPSNTSFCAGQAISIAFTKVGGNFFSGNVFTAQLSNPAGSFSLPTPIGSLVGTGSGTISATIPVDALQGSAYRIRIVGSNPSSIGPNNGTNLTINELPLPSIVGLASSFCDSSQTITLTGSPSGGTFTVNGLSATTINPADLPTGTNIIYTYTDAAGCTGTVNRTIEIEDSSLSIFQIGGIMSNVGLLTQITNACLGNEITLTAVNAGTPIATYQWQRNGLDLTGEELSTLSLTSGWGVYKVKATTISGCQIDSDTFGVSFWGLPNAQAGSDRSVCPGTSVLIGANNNTSYSYSWYPTTGLSNPNISKPSLTLTVPSARYYVYVTNNPTGCMKVDSMDANLLTAPVPPAITTTAPATFVGVSNINICEGTANIVLTPSNVLGTHLQWLKNNTQVTLTANLSNTLTISNTNGTTVTYTARTKGVNGCFSAPSNPVDIQMRSAALPVITPTGVGNIIYLCFNGQASASQLLTATVASGTPTYSWFQSGVANSISTDVSYMATITNTQTSKGYNVKAYYANGCMRTSVGRVVRKDNSCREMVEDFSATELTAFPNPTTNELTLSLQNEADETANLLLVNTLGQVMRSQTWQLNQGKNEILLNVKNLANGVYYLHLTTASRQQLIKVVKE